PPDEEVGEARTRLGRRLGAHGMFLLGAQRSTGAGTNCAGGARSLFTITVWPLRSLKAPLLTSVSPPFSPDRICTKSPRRSPRRTNCCLATSVGLSFGALAGAGAGFFAGAGLVAGPGFLARAGLARS